MKEDRTKRKKISCRSILRFKLPSKCYEVTFFFLLLFPFFSLQLVFHSSKYVTLSVIFHLVDLRMTFRCWWYNYIGFRICSTVLLVPKLRNLLELINSLALILPVPCYLYEKIFKYCTRLKRNKSSRKRKINA